MSRSGRPRGKGAVYISAGIYCFKGHSVDIPHNNGGMSEFLISCKLRLPHWAVCLSKKWSLTKVAIKQCLKTIFRCQI